MNISQIDQYTIIIVLSYFFTLEIDLSYYIFIDLI
jgi:hypothetical protein